MTTSLTGENLARILESLHAANTTFKGRYPGESGARQAVHTVYGGAHLFKADSAPRLAQLAIRHLDANAPDWATFARAIGIRGSHTLPADQADIASLTSALEADNEHARHANPAAWLAHTIERRVRAELEHSAVEDFRIDFEDGYGNRPDEEEDACAVSAAEEVAKGMQAGTLPPFIGIRVKPLSQELHGRAIRTLDIFVTTLSERTGGKLPDNFVVTIPKVVMPEQVDALVDLFEQIEGATALPLQALRLELMIETTQSIIGHDGACMLASLVDAARGRCVAAHFGVYDYTASCTITADHQHMRHPACDFARHVMQVALAGTGIALSDGATNVMPVAPHRARPDGPPLTPTQVSENLRVVHRAWKLHYDDVRHSLMHAYYQGWDLHPGQLPTRYAALYAFFLEGIDAASDRLRNFIDKAAQATLVGDIFDDAATGQGLLNFFLRGVNCGAITEAEALATGLTLAEFRTRSFAKIIESRRTR